MRLPCLQHPGAFEALLAKLYNKRWITYAKRPFGGAEHVYRYLGQYTHRVGLSNRRLQSFDGTNVTFATRDGKSTTLSTETFIERFVLHILPKGFTRIRHYGLLAPYHVKGRLEQARKLLLAQAQEGQLGGGEGESPLLADIVSQNQDEDIPLPKCPRCKVGLLVPHPLIQDGFPSNFGVANHHEAAPRAPPPAIHNGPNTAWGLL